jgi:DNA polymerase-3 subunit chi
VPDIAFHTGLADKAAYTCRLLRKAWRQGARVVVAGAPEALNRLDVLLWTFETDEFIPHARQRGANPPDAALARTPIWLADDPATVTDSATATDSAQGLVLVNLGPGPAPGFERFARVIEIVGEDADDTRAGRLRWRHYQSAGLTPTLHDAAAASGVSRSRTP